MLLSIVMMIKNEEKYLEKTLDSLKNLMQDIESELIILDTGSTDNSVNICKKYTDKVYFFEWNNNFGEMRNISISYAKGEWILILDADEELVEYKNLIKFFKTELCKKYNSATIQLKNITSKDEQMYSMISILRLFRNEKIFKYEGAIHEQPVCEKPIFNNIALFNHYGYLYENEEVKQKKLKRNEKILLEQLLKKPNDPYIHFQISKNYICYSEFEEARFYMERSFEIYRQLGYSPIAIVQGLANIYLNTQKYNKCEEICNEYIKKDNKNIDIYYCLAISQKMLKKYYESIESFKRYIFLVDSYEISTQFNDLSCEGNTVSFKKKAIVDIIEIYYLLEQYDKVIEICKDIESDVLKQVYKYLFYSLYRKDKIEYITKLYIDISNSSVDKYKFELEMEKTILEIKKSDRKKLYIQLAKLECNYGVLNKLRIGHKIDLSQYKEILSVEIGSHYSDLLYYGLNQNISLENILNDLSFIKIQQLADNLILTRKEIIIDLYNYVVNANNTLDIKKVGIYTCLVRSIMLYGNLFDEKYEMLFLMYIRYRYEYIQMIYNLKLTDVDVFNYITDKNDLFVARINNIEKYKENDKLEYLRGLKQLVMENKEYKNAIEILINKFGQDFNESKEMKDLKQQYKNIIENSINNGELDQASILIDEYKTISKEDIDIKNMKGIIHILKNEYEKAEIILKQAFLMDSSNVNTLFNIAYLKEVKLENNEAIAYYKKIIGVSNDKELVIEATNKIKELEKLTYSEVL